MADQDISRKLVVIVHADVVDSTVLVQRDEMLAHKRIIDTFQRFSSIIEGYGGTVHEVRGDALVAEFARASDAACAALSFQHRHTEWLLTLSDDIKPTVRIGISLGEVVLANNTVTGGGVVLAQRVEQLAEAGGLCITAAIHEALPQHMPFDQYDLGEQEVKGFEESVRVYRVGLKAGGVIPLPEKTQQPKASNTLRTTAAVAAIVLVIVGGVAFWFQPWLPEEDSASVERMAFPLPDKPSIAVLPFANMSDDAAQEYFVDGMTEDLITDLSKLSGLFVIARNTVFTYKGKPVKVSQVAEELGVRYVLEGSVRRAGDQVRINAQLIDATTGGHLWAERYDGTLDDVFGLQDRVTSKIVTILAVQLSASDQNRTTTKETPSTDAYDAFLKGWNQYLKQTPDGFVQAIAHFERASGIDPSYSRTYAALAATYWQSWKRFWHTEVGERRWHDARVQAEQFLRKAMENPTPLAHQLASAIALQRGNLDESIAEAERSIAMDPNDSEGYITLADALIYSGDAQQGVLMVEHAMRLNPHYPPYYLYELGLGKFALGLLDQAVVELEKAIALNPEDVWAKRILLATYGKLGRDDESARIRESLSRSEFVGLLTTKSASFWHPFQDSEHKRRFVEGLRQADVPD